jgi:hypothetical protein
MRLIRVFLPDEGDARHPHRFLFRYCENFVLTFECG